MRVKKRVLLLLFLFGCSSIPLSAQTHPRVEGIILDVHDTALSHSTIRLGGQTTRSAHDGSFYFKDIPAGKHFLEVSAVGYNTLTDTIMQHASENLVLEIRLTPHANTLHEVSIVGKSTNQKIREQPIRTVVIDTRAISTQATSLTDLMNRNTGIRVRQSGGLGSRPEISINGFQGRAIQYFKDGIPLQYLGEGYSIASLPLEALERIEVYKGVLPVSLGADALGGAVNLVTKRQAGTNLNAFYQIGSFNTHRLGVQGTTETNNQSWFLGTELFFNYADNDYKAEVGVVDPETKNIESVRLPLLHNAFRNYYGEVFGGMQHQPWADELRLGLVGFALNRQQQHPALMTDAYGALVSTQHTVAPTLRYKKSFWNNRLSIDQFASYNDLQTRRIDTLKGLYDWYGNLTPKTTIGESRLPSFSHVHEKQWTARTHIVYRTSTSSRLGINYVFTDAHRSGTDPHGQRISGTDIDVLSLPSTYQKHVLGASLDHFWLDGQLQNQAMAKWYHYNAYGLQNTWFSTDVSLLDERRQKDSYWGFADALKYQLSPTSFIRTSLEFAYRLPQRDELFGDNVFIVPNFELSPERSLNINIGYQYTSGDRFSGEINSFYRKTKDLILLVPIQAPNAQFQNQEHVKGYGFDIDVSYKLLDPIRIHANASWQDLRLFGINNAQDAWKNKARLRNTPYFFANAGLSGRYQHVFSLQDDLHVFVNYNFLREFYLETIPKDVEPGGFLGLSGHALLTSNLVIPNQHLLNAGFTYQWAMKRISIGAEIRNILDTRLFDYYRIPKPGRGIHFKISYQLK